MPLTFSFSIKYLKNVFNTYLLYFIYLVIVALFFDTYQPNKVTRAKRQYTPHSNIFNRKTPERQCNLSCLNLKKNVDTVFFVFLNYNL